MPVLECACCNELYYSAHGSIELACEACGTNVWRVFDDVSFARVVGLPRDFEPGDHGAILYTDPEAAAGFCAAYLRAGLERGERVAMVAPEELAAAIESQLEPGEWSAMERREPERCYLDFEPQTVAERVAAIARGSELPVRLLCGPDADSLRGVTADGWRRYERICHELVLELGAIALCAYDGRHLPAAFPPVAIEAHPLISRDGGELRRNPDFSYEAA